MNDEGKIKEERERKKKEKTVSKSTRGRMEVLLISWCLEGLRSS